MFPSPKWQYPLELLMTIAYENMILNKSIILHLDNMQKRKFWNELLSARIKTGSELIRIGRGLVLIGPVPKCRIKIVN
jgi:hypothetical protein